ncbi:inclusion body family protein [Burkholderia anthina]|uniref:inclusion body family protein n=1 Tax=Burkholderia anthina TaxID=179879 RepID=UPI00163956F4|nr:inclusion body family protein [Burkholderia anthina]
MREHRTARRKSRNTALYTRTRNANHPLTRGNEIYKGPSVEASIQEITLLSVINAEKVIEEANGKVSSDKSRPVQVGHNHQYLLCDDPYRPSENQGAWNIKFYAKKFDSVNFTGTTIHTNSRYAVIVYDLVHQSGDNVLDLRPGIGLTHRGYTLARAAEPNPETKDGLDAIHVPSSFSLFDTRVIGNGTESFWIRFALYTLAPDGETQKFHSYYEWDPTITTLAL